MRLVDWTVNPLVAAYFAAKDGAIWHATSTGAALAAAYKRTALDGAARIAVWALNAAEVHDRSLKSSYGEGVLQVVRVPQWGNANQIAQRGSFTVNKLTLPYLRQARNYHTVGGLIKHWSARDLESERSRGRETFEPDECYLRCVTLPIARARELLRLLALSGFDQGTVFPGYGGIVESMRETQLWDLPPPNIGYRSW